MGSSDYLVAKLSTLSFDALEVGFDVSLHFSGRKTSVNSVWQFGNTRTILYFGLTIVLH